MYGVLYKDKGEEVVLVVEDTEEPIVPQALGLAATSQQRLVE
jgi:hypothetical protein